MTLRFLPEAAVRAGALSSGQVDLIEGVQATDVGLFADQPGFKFLTGPSGAGTSFTLNIITPGRPPTICACAALRDGLAIRSLLFFFFFFSVRMISVRILLAADRATTTTLGNGVMAIRAGLLRAGERAQGLTVTALVILTAVPLVAWLRRRDRDEHRRRLSRPVGVRRWPSRVKYLLLARCS